MFLPADVPAPTAKLSTLKGLQHLSLAHVIYKLKRFMIWYWAIPVTRLERNHGTAQVINVTLIYCNMLLRLWLLLRAHALRIP